MKVIQFVFGIIVSLLMFDLCCELLSAADTLANIFGALLLTSTVVFMYKTKCLIKFNINLKNKNKK